MTKEKELLLIFSKVPEAGKVKTRLAADIGDERALEVYHALLARTREVVFPLQQTRKVYYTPQIISHDQWKPSSFQKALQSEGDLGQRMLHAFDHGFLENYARVCIIGTDCYDLTTEHIEQAFAALKSHDVVLGPSQDGGYYLLGMRRLYPELFSNKTWSTSTVAKDTRQDVEKLNLSLYELPTLNDIDNIDDLRKSPLATKYVSNIVE